MTDPQGTHDSNPDEAGDPPAVEITESKPPLSRRRRWWRRIKIAGVVGLIGATAFLTWVYTCCFAEPPPLEGRPAILDATVELDPATGRSRLGESWFEMRPGHSRISLAGDPFTIGFANARLTEYLLKHQEETLIGTIREFFPSPISFGGIALAVIVNNRNLPDYVPLEYQHEIHGLSRGSADPFPEYGPRYHRLLNYHAAHDISHWVWDQPVVGCTAFAAVGSATRSGNLLVGRNFDFEAGRHFDTNKIIGLYRPTEGNAFLSVSWPGMAGAVTGINSERIFCSLNGAHSEDRSNIGTPVSLLVRRVLQYASNLDEATAILRDGDVFVSDSYLLADGKTGRAVVVEKSPAKFAVREMKNDVLLQTNHFETDTFAEDRGNLAYQAEGTSIARHARLAELVERHHGTIDPARVVEILRDRRGVGDVELSLGHRSSLDALIATHSVACDVTRGVLWVSRGPHLLGEYDPYSIEGFGDDLDPLASLPADPLLGDPAVDALSRRREWVERAEAELDEDEKLSSEVRTALEAALDEAPNDWRVLLALARAAELERRPNVGEWYRRAQAAQPPFRVDRQRIEEALGGERASAPTAEQPPASRTTESKR